MSEPIIKMIKSSNPQEISNYIKNYLPDDPVNLQRIYNQLLQFSTNFDQTKQRRRYNSLKNIKIGSKIDGKHGVVNTSLKKNNQNQQQKQSNSRPPLQYFDRMKQQYINGRYNALTRNLKDAGIRPQKDSLLLGLSVFKHQQQKIVKPLQSNSKVIFNQKTQITDQIKRFNINTKFYQNDIEDAQIDEQKFYDRKMKAFLDRRQSSLADIMTHKNQIKKANKKKFPNIQSKLFQKSARFSKKQSLLSLAVQSCPQKFCQSGKKFNSDTMVKNNNKTFQTQKKSNYKKQKLMQANQLLKYCKNSLTKKAELEKRYSIDNQKLYDKTLGKLSSQINFNNVNKIQIQISNLQTQQQISKKVKNSFFRQFIQKYNGNYLKMVKNLSTKRAQQEIIQNRKDLLKNQIMFRKIMKSSDQQ